MVLAGRMSVNKFNTGNLLPLAPVASDTRCAGLVAWWGFFRDRTWRRLRSRASHRAGLRLGRVGVSKVGVDGWRGLCAIVVTVIVLQRRHGARPVPTRGGVVAIHVCIASEGVLTLILVHLLRRWRGRGVVVLVMSGGVARSWHRRVVIVWVGVVGWFRVMRVLLGW